MQTVIDGLTRPFVWLYMLVSWTFWLFLKGLPDAWKWIRGQKTAPTHGNAGFAEIKELKDLGHLEPGGFLYGIQDGKRVFGLPEACVHMFAKRGEGKSQTFAANLNYFSQLAGEARPDFLINDPAMEHYRNMWPRLKAAGWELLLLNMNDPAGENAVEPNQTRYNPVSMLKNSTKYTYGRDLENIVSLVMPEFEEGPNSRHFTEAAHGVCSAMIDWEFQMKGSAASLAEPVRLLTTATTEERDAVIKQISIAGSEIAKAGVNVFTRVEKKEQGSFNSTIGRKLRVFNDLALKEMMSCPESPWTWEDVFSRPNPVAVFLVGGLGSKLVTGPFNRMVIGQCIDAVMRYWNQNGGPLRKPLRIFVDEAEDLGNCRPLQDAVTQLRKANVNTFLCWQSISQIRDNYKSPQPFIDGCDWIVTGGLKDEKLYEQVSVLMGDYTAKALSENASDSGSSQGSHEAPRRLRKVDEMKSTGRGKVVVLADRQNLLLDMPYKIGKSGVTYP